MNIIHWVFTFLSIDVNKGGDLYISESDFIIWMGFGSLQHDTESHGIPVVPEMLPLK